MKRIFLALMVLSLLVVAGCTLMQAPSTSYLNADKATHDTIGAEYVGYVQADDTKDAAAKQRRFDNITAWGRRIEQAQKAATQPTTAPAVGTPTIAQPPAGS